MAFNAVRKRFLSLGAAALLADPQLMLAQGDSNAPAAFPNRPVKLALVNESVEAAAAADILTAQLSGNKHLELVERNEIDRIYREQAMAAGSRDFLKLGRILGADGLLLMNVVKTKEATNLFLRVIDVKPGVVLNDGSFAWPLRDVPEWGQSVSGYLDLLLPKLSLSVKDAIPLSVVNLRSATQSAEAREMEGQLKLLTIRRLSREPQFFVLERQRMNLLSEEKELKVDDSSFWNGSYVLEGVVDQNGYSKEIMTINARLIPPQAGAPLLIEVKGSRTNAAELVNQLVLKVAGALKANPAASQWDPAAEAAKYFEEAGWALRWGMRREAQAAADSAWALGKRDLDCSTVRIKAYMVPRDTGLYQQADYTGYRDLKEVSSELEQHAGTETIRGLVTKEQNWNGTKEFISMYATKLPRTEAADDALRALELYYSFSQTLPRDEPKTNSAWYALGIADLTAASAVLQQFHFIPESQPPVIEKLSGLRSLCRSVAEWIGKSPTVHESYYVRDRFVSYEGLYPLMDQPNLFDCEVQWGCFWQDKPEDSLAMYRELMSTPVFRYVHRDFWLRDLNQPRLAAWTDEDRKRVPALWDGFMRELDGSSNLFWQLEAKAIRLAEASHDSDFTNAASQLFGSIFANRDLFVTNHADVSYLEWGTDGLIGRGGIVTPAKEWLEKQFYSDYSPKFEAIHKEYYTQTLPAGRFMAQFEKQKTFLREKQPYDFFAFVKLFDTPNYSKAQALELQPLAAAYKSNLETQAETLSGIQLSKIKGAISRVKSLEDNLNRVLNPPAARTPPPVMAQVPKPVSPAKPPVVSAAASDTPPEIITHILTVGKFLAIPLEGLPGDRTHHESSVQITTHHWYENRLVLDFQYDASIYSFDEKGNWKGTRVATIPVIAILDPVSEQWDVIVCPESDFGTKNKYYHRTVLLQGALFNCDGGQVRKYDSGKKEWIVLPLSDGNNYELFAVNGSLYAANPNVIMQIVDEGKATRILASTRRRPAASNLDTNELGLPMLAEGPNHSLRAALPGHVFDWAGDDWREAAVIPAALAPPDIFGSGLLFRNRQDTLQTEMRVFMLGKNTDELLLCFWKKFSSPYSRPGFSMPGSKPPPPPPTPCWSVPADFSLNHTCSAINDSDLYFMVDHSVIKQSADNNHTLVRSEAVARDGYNASLLCFTRDLSEPQKVYLKFDSTDGCAPAIGGDYFNDSTPPTWMLFGGGNLFFGLDNPGAYTINGNQPIGIGCKQCVWMLPVSQLNSAVAEQKRLQTHRKNKLAALAEQARQKLLKKYDLNHDGVIDAGEREEALDDPDYLKSELDAINPAQTGWLKAEDLAWFDGNTNKTLEPRELAGIEITQHLLAERLLKKFDENNDGLLDRAEFNELYQFSAGTGPGAMKAWAQPFPDDNRDGKVDLDELESFLKKQTRNGLRPRGTHGEPLPPPMSREASQPLDARQRFKEALEFYWQNPAAFASRPMFNNRISSGTGNHTNESQTTMKP